MQASVGMICTLDIPHCGQVSTDSIMTADADRSLAASG